MKLSLGAGLHGPIQLLYFHFHLVVGGGTREAQTRDCRAHSGLASGEFISLRV